jgi:hypothetical protein
MGKAPQHVYNAIRQAREEGSAWVTWKGVRYRLVPLTWAKDRCFDVPMAEDTKLFGCFNAIVKSRRPGGIVLAWIDAYKDVGERIRIYEGGLYGEQGGGPTRMGGWDQIVAVVVEQHARGQRAQE